MYCFQWLKLRVKRKYILADACLMIIYSEDEVFFTSKFVIYLLTNSVDCCVNGCLCLGGSAAHMWEGNNVAPSPSSTKE